jgi:hypothetical protein
MQSRDNLFAIGANELALVAPDVVDMHFGETEIEEALDMLPMPSQKRPGYIAASVAADCAMMAGWYRYEAQVTPGP